MEKNTRYSTREVAERLGCTLVEARQLLKAAGISYTRAGHAMLWDGVVVDIFVETLNGLKKGRVGENYR